MDTLDNYLQPREAVTKNEDLRHFQEVGGYCPLCGKALLIKKGLRYSKKYQIAHIYPNSPDEHQKKELDGLERLGTTCEDFENKIALCRDCHGLFDDYTTKEEYLKILKIKKQLLEESKARESIASEEIENELIAIIEKLSFVSDVELKTFELKYKGVKVVNKLEVNYSLLRRKIESNVCTYYGFIKETMRNLVDENKLNFDLLALKIRTAYMKASISSNDKVIIFNLLVDWVMSKNPLSSREACEILISFFVQDCEVFDEISE